MHSQKPEDPALAVSPEDEREPAEPHEDAELGSRDQAIAASNAAQQVQLMLRDEPVQLEGEGGLTADAMHEAAAEGVQGSGEPLPHLEQIQASFGPEHDLSGVKAHVGGQAAAACDEIGAAAYATGDQLAFAQSPDLHTAAHEAAHVIQQQQGVQLLGGIGAAGDRYERNADAVADRVVAGKPATDLLSEASASTATAAGNKGLQRKSRGARESNASTGKIVKATAASEGGVRLRFNKGADRGIKPGWTVTLASGHRGQIVETTPRESVAVLELSYDLAMSLAKQPVTFTPPNKSRSQKRKERKLESKAQTVAISKVIKGDAGEGVIVEVPLGGRLFVDGERERKIRMDESWTAQLLDPNGSVRALGKVNWIDSDYAYIAFPVAGVSEDASVRLIPDK